MKSDEKRRRAREQADRWMRCLVDSPESADEPAFRPALTPRGFAHFWMAWAFVNRLSKPEDQSES